MANYAPLVIQSGQVRQATTGDVIVCPNVQDSAMTSGSVLFAGSSGLISQDNANFTYGPTGYSGGPNCEIGPAGSNPDDAVLEAYAATAGLYTAHFHNNGVHGATGGPIVSLNATATGIPAAMASGDRLGSIQFAGTYDNTLAVQSGSAMNGFTTQAWTSAHAGSKLVFNTVPNNSLTRTLALTLDQDQSATFTGALTAASITDSGLVSGRVTYAGASGLLNDSANMTFDGTTLSAQDLTLPATTSSVGQFKIGASTFHTYFDATADGHNFFGGIGSGNFTLSPSGGASSLASNNIGLGYHCLVGVTTGYGNICFGFQAGLSITTGYQNTAIGYNSLALCVIGHDNFAFGADSCVYTTGNYNVAMGTFSGYQLSTGSSNTLVGTQAGQVLAGGGENVFVGAFSAQAATGNGNVAIGYGSFSRNVSGSSCVCIGVDAGYYETGSNKLFIDNAARASEADARVKALIYGVFDATTANQLLAVNGTLNLGSYQTTVNGTAGTAVWSMPFSGTAYKKFVVRLDGFTSAGTILTFPTVFSKAPYVYGDAAAVAIAVTTTTTVTLTSIGAVGGFIFIEGY